MKIKLKNIITLPEMQARVRMDEDLIQTLESVYRKEQTLYAHPILVWKQEDGRWLVIDGHHRLEAAKRAGLEEINAKEPFYPHMKAGYGWLDAQKVSITTNARHGARLTRADVTRAVGLLLARDPAMGPEEIARVVNRSKSVVYECMRELSGSGKLTLPETRTGKDGKIRPTTYAKREVFRKPEPEDMTEAPARLEAEEGGTDAPKPWAETVYCAGGCGKFVSRVYLEELEAGDDGRSEADWTKIYNSWHCPACLEVWKEESSQKARRLKEEIEELVVLYPCDRCGGTATVQVNRYNWTARITCRECGNTTGFHDPPHNAVHSWKTALAHRLRQESEAKSDPWVHIVAADGGAKPVLMAPCPICGEEPTVYEMDPDSPLETGWVADCAGHDHRFRVYGRDEEAAVEIWNKVFAFAEVVK